MHNLLKATRSFLEDRDWLQFHDPKSDALNILVEIGELAEHFVHYDPQDKVQAQEIAYELADVMFATLSCAIVTQSDIKGYSSYKEHSTTYRLSTPQQGLLGLIGHASQLGDIFTWVSREEAVERAREYQTFITQHIHDILTHAILLTDMLNIDLYAVYAEKMEKSARKYPVDQAAGSDYLKIKDQSRGRINE